jgi:hypothetical protein
VGEDRIRGHSRPESADTSGQSGWITTEVAAKAVRVSPRTIRRYIDQGKLDAKPQGEGVNRTWLVSVDSLHALRASRTIQQDVPDSDRGAEFADSIADVFREMAARLETRAEEAAELRVRLELTEQAQSTLDDERRRALEELAEERRRREEAERERDELRRELEAAREARESPESPGLTRAPTDAGEGLQTATERPFTEGEPERRGFWARLFGGGR